MGRAKQAASNESAMNRLESSHTAPLVSGSHHLAQGDPFALLFGVAYRHGQQSQGRDENGDGHEAKDKHQRVLLMG